MANPQATILQVGSERATLYVEGGVSFSCWVKGIGWVVDDEPSQRFEADAMALREWLNAKNPLIRSNVG